MSINDMKLKAKKYSPELLLGAGIVGIIAGTVKACKATPKAIQIMEETNKTLETIKEVQKKTDEETYTPQDFRKDIALTYFQTAGKLVKTYGPAILVIPNTERELLINSARKLIDKLNTGLPKKKSKKL